VAAAAERAKRQLALEKQRREAEERQRQQREVRTVLPYGFAIVGGWPMLEKQRGEAEERQRQQREVSWVYLVPNKPAKLATDVAGWCSGATAAGGLGYEVMVSA